jgi:hypothetical protein
MLEPHFWWMPLIFANQKALEITNEIVLATISPGHRMMPSTTVLFLPPFSAATDSLRCFNKTPAGR